MLAALVARYPMVRIDLETADTRTMLKSLEAERLDVFVGESQSLAGLPHLQIERLPALQTAFFVRSGHPLSKRRLVSLAALADYPVAGPRLPAGVSDYFSQQLAQDQGGAGSTGKGLLTVSCDDMHALRTLMLSTDAVVLVPLAMMAGLQAEGQAVALPLRPTTELRAPYGVVSLAGHLPSPAARAFVTVVHEVLARHPAMHRGAR
ncbi:substrate-binding domain-containing protein [Cupriavidus basilensis]